MFTLSLSALAGIFIYNILICSLMGYTTTSQKLGHMVAIVLVYNILVVSVILAEQDNSGKRATDNLARCQKNLPAEVHLCFVWSQAVTDWAVGPSLAFGGNAGIYVLFRSWNAGQHDNHIKRLMGQAYRISNNKIISYVPAIADDGWTGVLTYKCRNRYDDYVAAVIKYNKNDLDVEELQQCASELFIELSNEYAMLKDEAIGRK